MAARAFPTAFYGRQDEKDRFLVEFRATLAAQALAGVHGCPLYTSSSTARAFGSFGSVVAPWMPDGLHTVIHDLYGSSGEVELSLLSDITPGTDLEMALSIWRLQRATSPEEDQLRSYINIERRREKLQRSFYATLLAAPIRSVP